MTFVLMRAPIEHEHESHSICNEAKRADRAPARINIHQ
jgi:hypothetical protein